MRGQDGSVYGSTSSKQPAWMNRKLNRERSHLLTYQVAGNEYVIEKRIDTLIIDGVSIEDSIIQIGDMDYGFGINGIIGGDLLIRTKMIIDYERRVIFHR